MNDRSHIELKETDLVTISGIEHHAKDVIEIMNYTEKHGHPTDKDYYDEYGEFQIEVKVWNSRTPDSPTVWTAIRIRFDENYDRRDRQAGFGSSPLEAVNDLVKRHGKEWKV